MFHFVLQMTALTRSGGNHLIDESTAANVASILATYSAELKAHAFVSDVENSSRVQGGQGGAEGSPTMDLYSMLDLRYEAEEDFAPILKKSSTKSPILKQNWQCPQCDYSTPVKQYITQHIRRHTGEKPFKCNLCDYRAAQKQSVTYHMRRHTGEKPFKCTHCDYCSSSRQNLDRHVRRHTGEMPYGCPYCSYRSITKGPVVDHMRSKHGEMECDKSLVVKLEAKGEGGQLLEKL